MAEHKSGPVELGAPMDYKEHEKSYDLFVKGAKYGTMHVVFLLIAMAVGFFTSAGFLFSVLLFIILSVGGILLF
ncbi:MAG TPA: aa3-type cytochrome c oxidase subunit IV [Ensifer sp.]|nr:aa3-type cytochrome c oxidase subunit IV [Ensifer sp.]